MTNISKWISKITFYGCWITIILISFILIDSISTPWEKQYLGISLPKINPLVQIDNKYAIPPHPSYHLEESQDKHSNFYSIVTSESYSEVFYRPDYKRYPTETLLLLFFSIITYMSLTIFFFLLSQIVDSVNKETPFSPTNYRRLFYMGLLMIFFPVIRTLHSAIMADFLSNSPRLIGWDITASFLSFWLVPLGVLLVILGYVFKQLILIYEEQKLTV